MLTLPNVKMRIHTNQGGVEMLRFAAVLMAVLLSGCVMGPGFPGYISESRSAFDQSTQYRMEPANVNPVGGGLYVPFNLGLVWTSGRPYELGVIAQMTEYRNLVAEEGLQFNIDGRIVKVSSSQPLTRLRSEGSGAVSYPTSTRIYDAPRELLDNLMKAQRVVVRLHTLDGYLEGVFTEDTPTSAIRGFREFQKKIDARL